VHWQALDSPGMFKEDPLYTYPSKVTVQVVAVCDAEVEVDVPIE
jgi:hypothetical protein